MTSITTTMNPKKPELLNSRLLRKKSEQRFGFIEEDIEKLKLKIQKLIDGLGKPSEGPVDLSSINI